jgi:hypothetical protein
VHTSSVLFLSGTPVINLEYMSTCVGFHKQYNANGHDPRSISIQCLVDLNLACSFILPSAHPEQNLPCSSYHVSICCLLIFFQCHGRVIVPALFNPSFPPTSGTEQKVYFTY